jgi:hypothetical protein
MASLKRVKLVAEVLRYAGIKARASSSDNSITVRGKKGYDLARRNQIILANKIKVKLGGKK